MIKMTDDEEWNFELQSYTDFLMKLTGSDDREKILEMVRKELENNDKERNIE